MSLIDALSSKLIRDPQDHSKCLKKAEEVSRLLNVKLGASNGLGHLSESCKAVICLNIAAKKLGIEIPQVEVLQSASVTRAVYERGLRLVKKILSLDSSPTPVSLCQELGCPEITDNVQTLLNNYWEAQRSKVGSDHPMYTCAAILAVAKAQKYKVSKRNVKSASGIKGVELERLTSSFATYLPQTKKKMVQEETSRPLPRVKAPKEEESDEEYEAWKERILREAAEG